MRNLAIALVIIVALACAFGADLWLTAKQAEGWSTLALIVLIIGGGALAFPDDVDVHLPGSRDRDRGGDR